MTPDRRASRWNAAVGAAGDLGVLVPIIVLLVAVNGLSATAVLVPVGTLYFVAAVVYRVPVPVQPMKAMTAVAIASDMAPDVIAAGALAVGVLFVILGSTGLLDRLAGVMPVAVVRGVQLAVGVALTKIAYDLVAHPDDVFTSALPPLPTIAVAGVLVVVFMVRPRAGLTVALGAAVAVMMVAGPADAAWGPTGLDPPDLTSGSFAIAVVALVIPQAPLTLTSSCLATSDACRHYYGPRAKGVSTGRLALTLGAGNLVSGLVAGMPMCHGSGGVSAHYRFGGRDGLTPAIAGVVLMSVGLVLGADFAARVGAFPLPLLVALLLVAALWHLRLLASVQRRSDVVVALVVGAGSLVVNLGALVVIAIAEWWVVPALRRGPTMGRPADVLDDGVGESSGGIRSA